MRRDKIFILYSVFEQWDQEMCKMRVWIVRYENGGSPGRGII